jgi:hypothetical protein
MKALTEEKPSVSTMTISECTSPWDQVDHKTMCWYIKGEGPSNVNWSAEERSGSGSIRKSSDCC